MTKVFAIDPIAVAAQSARAAERSTAGEGPEFASRLRVGKTLELDALAALFLSEEVSTDELLEIARQRREADDGPRAVETFSPLYLTNECDGECLMCGMRRFNADLHRETSDADTSRKQLEILYQRGMRGVALLTGEYHRGKQRDEMMTRTRAALCDAFDEGFTHVLINVGSLEVEDYDSLLADLPRRDDGKLVQQLTMCTFQETYDPEVYARFMGSSDDNPRADSQRRLENFDRAADAGMRSVNPGVLLGLNRDLAFEIIALAGHVQHLLERGMAVYISLPRLRKASGAERRAGVSDDDLARVVSLFSAQFPETKVVLSTREPPKIQQRLLPVIGVLTAGSPGVAPYSEASARFDIEASQFEVSDQRPFEVILGDCLAIGAKIEGYEPVAPLREQVG
jgi:2-iminoacetate synthase